MKHQRHLISRIARHILMMHVLIAFPIHSTLAEHRKSSELDLFFIVDGLRPDLISESVTPNLFRLARSGVWFSNSHAVFPTVTRVNSAAISTGSYPRQNGILSNNIYIPSVSSLASFSTGDYRNLLKLLQAEDGQLLTHKTWIQKLHKRGIRGVAFGTGSTGSAFLLNPHAPQGVGVLINGYFEPDSVLAFPAHVNKTLLQRFGPPPVQDTMTHYMPKVDWAIQVINDYVLPELKPDVFYCWLTEPDHTQHDKGIGAPETMQTISHADGSIGLIFKQLESMDLLNKTNVFVVSDHGFSTIQQYINVSEALVSAGLKNSSDSDDVILASSGESVLLHIKNHDADKISKIVKFLYTQPWCGVLFTESKADPMETGWVEGTFSLDLIHMDHPERKPDIVLTFDWSSEQNRFGFAGMDATATGSDTRSGDGLKATHGSMSPWTIRNTMIAAGPDFKSGVKSLVPACSIDFTSTLLWLHGIPLDNTGQGRILFEALENNIDPEKVVFEHKVIHRTHENFEVYLQISCVDTFRYIDKSWRKGIDPLNGDKQND